MPLRVVLASLFGRRVWRIARGVSHYTKSFQVCTRPNRIFNVYSCFRVRFFLVVLQRFLFTERNISYGVLEEDATSVILFCPKFQGHEGRCTVWLCFLYLLGFLLIRVFRYCVLAIFFLFCHKCERSILAACGMVQ